MDKIDRAYDNQNEFGLEDTTDNTLDPIDFSDHIIDGDDTVDDASDYTDELICKNAELANKSHPITGVPFERRQIDYQGRQTDVVIPLFNSKYDIELPRDMLASTDNVQFTTCNQLLRSELALADDISDEFDELELAIIDMGYTPPGYTWHHDVEVGKMQLVDSETHRKTGHTGGRKFWGGGTSCR